MGEFNVLWDADRGCLEVRLSGAVTALEVRVWQAALEFQLGQLEPGAPFKVLVDLSGSTFAEVAAQQAMRAVIPAALAKSGFVVGDKAADTAALPPRDLARGCCIAVAHVHDDRERMAEPQRLYGSKVEGFFADVGDARSWLAAVTLG